MSTKFEHTSVLLSEAIEWLNVQPNHNYVDGTLGGGGHAREILQRNSPKGLLLGIDRDPGAIRAAQERLAEYKPRVRYLNAPYATIREQVHGAGDPQIHGALLDLGLSSFQISDAARGFSFQADAPLDMRMGEGELTAAKILNTYSQEAIEKILREYGEEPRARSLAQRIVARRLDTPFERTSELVDVVLQVYRGPRRKIHPATLTFQALRIAVNDELGQLERFLVDSLDLIESGGRIVIITFHSLEDRLVKQFFNSQSPKKSKRNKYAPAAPVEGRLRVLTPKPITPSVAEIERNPRARSAKLRVAEVL